MCLRNRNSYLVWFSLFSLILLPGCASPSSGKPSAFHVILDPGHSHQAPGTRNFKGIDEVYYNDTLAALLKRRLEDTGRFKVTLTRKPQDQLDLKKRIEIANRFEKAIFLSVHHDSAQEKYLKSVQGSNPSRWETIQPIQGFSLFVSAENEKYRESVKLAGYLGRALISSGRRPSFHHAENIPGENRPLVDEDAGVFRYDDLAVLKKVRMPAVLIEAAVIVDRADEAFIAQPENQAAFATALVAALTGYFAAGI